MLETGIALGLLALLGLAAWLCAVVPWPALLAGGTVLVLVGLGAGVPAGLAYHVALGRVLRARGALPPRWWLRPTAHHGALDRAERRRVLRWFVVGAVGFVLVVVGCVLVAVAALRSR